MSGRTRRSRGRPRRQYRIRVRGERREHPDYDKLARALLEHAAMEERARGIAKAPDAALDSTSAPEPVSPPRDGREGGSR